MIKTRLFIYQFFIAALILFGAVQSFGQTTWNVPGDGSNDCMMVSPSCDTIQEAIDAAIAGDTVNVAAGNYPENINLDRRLTLRGAQVGVDACWRVAGESTITGAGTLLNLVTGSAGSIINGFTFSGGVTQINSSSGPIDDLQILNNRFVDFTGSGVFLNNSGEDITVNQNLIDGTSQGGGGGIFHLDQDDFDGFHFTNNCVSDGATGFFVDGNRQVGSSASRSPLFSGNLFERNGAGINAGTMGIENAAFSGNIFQDNEFDGLQGGPSNSTISTNIFSGNGRYGLRLTGFGGAGDPDRGAQDNTVFNNCFLGNGFTNSGAGIIFDAGQFPGIISTNTLNFNNIAGNAIGAIYEGGETIDAERNWWDASDGPSGDAPGSGDEVDGSFIDFDPFLTLIAENTPCSPQPTILLGPPTGTNLLFTDHTVTATVIIDGEPAPGLLVSFEVISGPNAGTMSIPNNGECSQNDDCTTDANGQVSWTYTSNRPGTDTIVASFTVPNSVMVESEPVEKIWERTPIATPTLSEWGLIALASILGIVAFIVMRRRKVTA